MKKYIVALYWLIAVVSYGAVWHSIPGQGPNGEPNRGGKLVESVVGAAVWPLYWSVRVWGQP